VALSSLPRAAILRAADSRRLRRFVQRHGMRLGAARFVAGETLDECVAVLRRLNDAGLHANTTLLGEAIPDAGGAHAVVAEELQQAGYRTAAFVSSFTLSTSIRRRALTTPRTEPERERLDSCVRFLAFSSSNCSSASHEAGSIECPRGRDPEPGLEGIWGRGAEVGDGPGERPLRRQERGRRPAGTEPRRSFADRQTWRTSESEPVLAQGGHELLRRPTGNQALRLEMGVVRPETVARDCQCRGHVRGITRINPVHYRRGTGPRGPNGIRGDLDEVVA